MLHRMVRLHMPLQQVLDGEGVGTGGRGAAVGVVRGGVRPHGARAGQHGAARAARRRVPRAHVCRALRLRAQRAAAARPAHPHLALAAVRHREVHLQTLQLYFETVVKCG